jgi:hypothetical protein
MIELLKFSHNRDVSYKQSCDDLRDIIDAFVEQSALDDWYYHFEVSYSLPRDVIKQQMKAYLSRSYDYRRCFFYEEYFQKERFKSAAKHVAFLSYVLYFSKHYPESVNVYELINQCIFEKDFNLLSKLIDLFGKQNVLNIAQSYMYKPEYKMLYRPEYKFYDRNEVTRTLFQETKKGLRLYLDLSKKARINLLPIASTIIKQYLYAYSIFKYNRSKYYIEQRYNGTSAVRNHIFHKFGGTYSCCTQIGVVPLGANGFYYDTDVFFSLGKETAKRAYKYGARIDHIVPVGSTAMECYYFNNNVNRTREKIYEIVYLTNKTNWGFHYLDAYSTFKDDYYDTFRWLADFSKKNPHLRIGIKKQPKSEVDEREREITENTSIKYIDKTLNSYEVAFQAKCAVTSGSTTGYELFGNGLPVLYLDPGRRSLFFPDRDDSSLDPYRVSNYDEFCEKMEIMLSGQLLNGAENIDKSAFCMDSTNVSERIYSWFLSREDKKISIEG